MTADPRWINKTALLALHEASLAEFGGARGLRDVGLLESSLARPQNAYAYGTGSCTIACLAASYAYGLARNHPFVDGNKRAAFLSIGLFLGLNGFQLAATHVSAVRTMVALAEGALDEMALGTWIDEHIEPS